jgi:hypothetical protein
MKAFSYHGLESDNKYQSISSWRKPNWRRIIRQVDISDAMPFIQRPGIEL